MNCERWSLEISERSRLSAGPSETLSHHLAECPRCAASWESQVELSRGLRRLRAAGSLLRSPDAARDRLLAAFDYAAFDRAAASRPARPRWAWVAVAATVVLAMAFALWKQPSPRQAGVAQPSAEVAEELALDNDFVPVPYAPPLAQGEVVEIVRMDLSPAALARLGIVTQAGYSSDVTAELAIGEDGLPRAVRLPDSAEILN